MVALGLQTLLLMVAAYLLGAMFACFVRRQLFTVTERAAAGAASSVEPLAEANPGVTGMRRFVPDAPEPDAPLVPLSPAPKASEPVAAASTAAVAAAPQAREDLQRIHAIDASTEGVLNGQGVFRYEHIASWTRADVERIAAALGIKRGRISRENWIEQAQILAKGGQTHYARRRDSGLAASAAPTADEGERRSIVQAAAAPPPPPAPVQAAPPPFVPPQVSERAAFARAASSPPDAVRPAPAAPGAAPAPASTAPVAVEPAKPIRPPAPAPKDNLQRISGVDAEMEKRLEAAGILRYGQIASWSAGDVERLDKLLAAGGRISRENWIEQAQILSKGGDTAFSRAFDRKGNGAALPQAETAAAKGTAGAAAAPAARPTDLGALRSVRSEAYQNQAEPGPEAAHRAGFYNRVVRTSPPQDLKRIRGIGVLIEKRLNAMGIFTYDQIANWTAEDIERVSRTLDFKGRIERENWVEQARILASGGATEFSRRVDRGEVETSRTKP